MGMAYDDARFPALPAEQSSILWSDSMVTLSIDMTILILVVFQQKFNRKSNGVIQKKDKEKKPYREISRKRSPGRKRKSRSGGNAIPARNSFTGKRSSATVMSVPSVLSFPISVENRIALTFDRGSFTEFHEKVEPVDFLEVQRHETIQDETCRDTGNGQAA